MTLVFSGRCDSSFSVVTPAAIEAISLSEVINGFISSRTSAA